MLFKELLMKCNYENIFKKMCDELDILDSDLEISKEILKENAYQYYEKEYNELLGLSYNKDLKDNIICVVNLLDEYDINDIWHYSSFMIKKSDIEKYKNKEIEFISKYDIAFSDWKDVLGYSVSDICVEKYGMELIAGIMLEELSFFGNNYDKARTKCDELVETLNIRAESVKNGTAITYTMEEVFDHLYNEFGFEYTGPTEEEQKNTENKINVNKQNLINFFDKLTAE